MLRFVWNRGLENFADAQRVRETVFIREQGFPYELDERDPEAYHLTGYEENRPVAAARMFPESAGALHVGRVCVLKERRGLRYGEALMREIAAEARRLGAKKLVLGAQLHAVPFYEKLGFAVSGPQFDDEGAPHLPMEYSLAQSSRI